MRFVLSNLVKRYLGLDIDSIEISFSSLIREGDTRGYMRPDDLGLIHISLYEWHDYNHGKHSYKRRSYHELARTIIHELTHIRQYRDIDGLPAKEWINIVDRIREGEYSERPIEKEARWFDANAPQDVINHVMASLRFTLTGKDEPWFSKSLKGGSSCCL